MEDNNIVSGRVIHVRKISKKLCFVIMVVDGNLVECVHYPDGQQPIIKGDYLVAKGNWQKKLSRPEQEFQITAVEHLATPDKESSFLNEMMDLHRIECLKARTIINASLPKFFLDREFMPVQSPSIVGDWVQGQTGAFPVSYYGDDAAYLTISTMLHHQLIQAMGYNNIFEIAKLYRKGVESSKNKLAEFTNVAVGIANGSTGKVIDVFTDMVKDMHIQLKAADLKKLDVPDSISFESISYKELLKLSKTVVTGHQLPVATREYMDVNFKSFVWVTGFPEYTRPFYVKGKDGTCDDCQLWYKGTTYLAAGGCMEEDPGVIQAKIVAEGKDPARFEFYLDAVKVGLPKIANIDLGIERFLGHFLENTKNADFSYFPRYRGQLNP